MGSCWWRCCRSTLWVSLSLKVPVRHSCRTLNVDVVMTKMLPSTKCNPNVCRFLELHKLSNQNDYTTPVSTVRLMLLKCFSSESVNILSPSWRSKVVSKRIPHRHLQMKTSKHNHHFILTIRTCLCAYLALDNHRPWLELAQERVTLLQI